MNVSIIFEKGKPRQGSETSICILTVLSDNDSEIDNPERRRKLVEVFNLLYGCLFHLEVDNPKRGRKCWNFIIGEIIHVTKIINSERGRNSLFPTVTLIIISSFGRKTFYLISDANVESL